MLSRSEIWRRSFLGCSTGSFSVLAELNSRNVPSVLGFRGSADLISAQVRCTRVEARKRAQAVERFGARRSLTGEPLEPLYPAIAEAFAAVGWVGARGGGRRR